VTQPTADPSDPPDQATRAPSSYDIGADRWSPRRARDRVYEAVQEDPLGGKLTEEDAYDVLLCTSEMVNAALFAGCTRMKLEITRAESRLRIAVIDDTPVAEGNSPSARAQRDCLRVIANLAHQWATEPIEDGRITWAEFSPGAH
jgi:hypothetical protein